MSNPNRSPARTPSIAIPGSASRSLDDILNINNLAAMEPTDGTSMLPQSHRYRADQPHSPSLSRSTSRSLYGALESSRPPSSTMRHATASSLGATRHALGGGSGPLLASRSASYSTRPGGPSSLGLNNPITSFEPRIVGGSAASSDFDGAPGSLSSSRTVSRSGLQASRPRRLSHKDSHPPANVIAPYGHHILGSGSPQPFKRPSYLQYTFLRERIQTETSRDETLGHSQATSYGLGKVEVKPDEHESDLARARPSTLQAIRKSSSQTVFEASSSRDDTISYLPTRWSEDNMLKFLHISEDGRNLYFHGPTSQGEKDAAAARSDRPIPFSCGIYYFEVTILDKGQKGHISIGFSQSSVKLNRLPGWEQNSWGYHGDDGNAFASERDGSTFGPRFSTKDVVGCGIDFSIHKAFYTKNGSFVGYAFDNIGIDNADLYPSVGLRTQQEAVRVNFGHESFKYDIDYYVLCAREQAWSRIQNTPVEWSISQTSDVFQLGKGGELPAETKSEVKEEAADDEHTPLQLPPDFSEPIIKLILSYLQHHGYERSATSLKAQADERAQKEAHRSTVLKSEPDLDIKMETDDLIPDSALSGVDGASRTPARSTQLRPEATQSRRRVIQAISSADIDQAINLLGESFPSVLRVDDGFLLLKLKCRKFVELILRTSEANKLLNNEAVQAFVSKPADSVMDVDDDALRSPTFRSEIRPETISSASIPVSPRMKRSSSRTPTSPAQAAYQNALSDTLAYGRALHKEVHESSVASRSDALELLRMTFSLVTYDDPLAAGGAVQDIASVEERERLAVEINQAILESEGRPSRPALERIYRQTSVVMTELALLGVGDAAFADMQAEFLDI